MRFALLIAAALVTGSAAQAQKAQKATPKPTAAKVAVKPTPPAKPKEEKAGPVWAVAFTPDGKQVAVGGYKKIFLYDTENGAKVGEWPVATEAIRTLTFSPDGKTIAIGTGVPAMSGSAAILDATTGKVIRTFPGATDTVESVAFEGNFLVTAASDEKVRVTEIATGKTIGTLSEHNGRCLSVAVPSVTAESEGGDIFVTGGSDNMVKVWDAQARRVVVNFDQCASPVWTLIALPRAGHFVAGSGDGRIHFLGVKMDGDGNAASNGGIKPRTGYVERQFGAHEGGVYALAVAPKEAFLVSGGADGKVCIWNLDGGKRKDLIDAVADVWSVAVSPDAKKIASASLDGRTRIYDAEKGTLLLELPLGLPPVVRASPSSGAALPALKPGEVVMSPKPGTGIGLTARYFANKEVAGGSAVTRVDPVVDFQWNGQPPAPGMEPYNFSARWEGWVEAPVAGTFTFYTMSDDGVRLWINGAPVIDNWTDHGATEDTSNRTVALKAGQRIPIRMEVYQGTGGAEARLRWSFTGAKNQEKQTIPKEYLYPVTDKPAVPPAQPKPANPAASKPAMSKPESNKTAPAKPAPKKKP